MLREAAQNISRNEVSADVTSNPADAADTPSSSLDEPFTRFPSPSDLGNNQQSDGIFQTSSYDDEFAPTLTNLDTSVEVDPLPTKIINTIHPLSNIVGDLKSTVQTRRGVKKTQYGECAFLTYVTNQKRDNHIDQKHCHSACFLSQVEPVSVDQALSDPSWVEAMQEEMQQFKN